MRTTIPGMMIYFFALLLSLFLLSGCSTAPKYDPEYAVTLPIVPAPRTQEVTGSIFHDSHYGTSLVLFEDIKARRIGDMLTIKLAEKTNATKQAKTDSSRKQTTDVTNPTLYGSTPEFNALGLLPLASNSGNTLATNLESSHDFEGEGNSSQSNSLSGDITVTVADVLPNGNMIVRGEKRLQFNQGTEYIKISGIVRPIDITADNSVLSTKLADATIVYSGEGQIEDANRMGWFARFFIGPFSPF